MLPTHTDQTYFDAKEYPIVCWLLPATDDNGIHSSLECNSIKSLIDLYME